MVKKSNSYNENPMVVFVIQNTYKQHVVCTLQILEIMLGRTNGFLDTI